MTTHIPHQRKFINLLALGLLSSIVSQSALAQNKTDNIPLLKRALAARTTANNTANPCNDIRPFYWEVGDKTQSYISGSVNSPTDNTVYTANSSMNIASASKWIFGAYVVEKKRFGLNKQDIKFLNFQSGYTNFSTCLPGQTVDGCLAFRDNAMYSPNTDGKFYYSGGHMQNHASQLGLGSLDNEGLAKEIQSKIGYDINLTYSQPQPAGGVVTTPANYARFLQKILNQELRIYQLLGTHAVCTNPKTCSTALNTPIPQKESWSYSLGHWVETDPVEGDGAFSSAGAFGFYPWIDANKTYYGIVARKAAPGEGGEGTGYHSAQCGRLIRKAWNTGVAQ